MDSRLLNLIKDYQNSVRNAVILMYRSGVQMPYSASAWQRMDIPGTGVLESGAGYLKHGFGCAVELKSGKVDFDFGANGEIDGFDLWRLVQFANGIWNDYGFNSCGEVEELFDISKDNSEFFQDGNLYYLGNGRRELAVDVDSRLSGDLLPTASQDQVLTLYTHYFLAADLMFKSYKKLDAKWQVSNRLSRASTIQARVYFFTWLGYLGVICEAITKSLNLRKVLIGERPRSFETLLPISDKLNSVIKANSDPLRKFRNNVFHLRQNHDEIRNFFSDGARRLEWAEDIHVTLDGFFSQYRVCCEVHYVLNHRLGELDSRNR